MIRSLFRRAVAFRERLVVRIVPAWLRTPRARLWGNAAAALVAWCAATVAVVVALYAPFPTPEQRFGALLGAPAAIIVPLWRTARLARGVEDARLLSWRRADCLLLGYLSGAAAVASSAGALTLVALHADMASIKAVLLLGLGGAFLIGLGRYFRFRLRGETVPS